MDNWIKKLLHKMRDAVGYPDDRANFPSLETMIGVPDAANSNVDDMLRTGYDSSGQSANVDGSVVERLEALQAALSVNAAAGGEFELDGDPDLWDALVNNSSADASIITTTGNRDASVIQRLAAIINAHGITDAASATGFEEDGTGGTLWQSLVAVKGTFTTSNATVPADTGRTEANDYFNGDLIFPLSGAVVGQARVIADFANAGGVFTLDSELPFTAAPGLVGYVIVHYKYPLVPAVDSTATTTSAHVVGNKGETIPAMNAAPAEAGATTSIVALAKAILERLGATPADPDDSVLTNVGQRDDTATLDTLGDVTTTSVQAKLRRLLLRFSADAFSATIQGAARTDVENMLQALSNYLSAGGAAWLVTANPGAVAKDNLEQTLEDFADVLAGAAGITTFPVRAVAADGISIAEVLRHAAESVGENTANNVFDSSTVVANEDGSVLERLEDIKLTADRAELQLADYDDFDVADADANTERWDTGYLNGAEGGSADINTTTAGQLRVSLDPDITPTASGYGVRLAQPIVNKYFTAIVDLDVSSFGTPNVSWATLGMRVSPTTYDANNVVYAQRQESSGGVLNRIAVGATFNGVGQGEQYFTTADTTVAFKIERWDNVWRCYYSLSQYPDFVWVLLAQYEDPSEFMDAQQSVYLDAYSPGNADAQTAIGDFDNFKLYEAIKGISQEVAGDYDSSVVVADEDGSVAERLEQVQEAVNRGTGTSLAANQSIVDAIGSTGSALIDTATSVVGILGVDDADNAFASTNVVSNRDGSVLERLEDLRAQHNETAEVHDVIIYPVAEDIGTTELADDGTSPVYMPVAAASTAAVGEGAAVAAWTEDIPFEAEGTITILSIYAEFEWQTRFLVGAGNGTNTVSKIQISGNGGGAWTDLTDNYTHNAAVMTNRVRAGTGRWLSTITAGANQLQLRLMHWVDVGNGISTSEASIRSNSYVRISYIKS